MKRRVVVTGMGVISSLSHEVEDLWQRVCAGESGIHHVKLFDVSDFKVKIGGDIYDWDPSGSLAAKEAKRVDRFSQFAMVAGASAIEDSGLDFSREDAYRCGVILGSGIGGLNEMQEQVVRLDSKGPDRVSAFTVPKMMINAASGNLAIQHGLRGTCYAVATACASASNAMGDALRVIRQGQCDVVLTGGSEAAFTQVALAAFQNCRALSMRNDDPAAASRPFDKNRDGFVFSEAAGLLVFEELEHAIQRDARIYAEVLGYGSTCDAGHITQPSVDGTGASRAMSEALLDAQVEPGQIDYINAHGTSTPLGDKAETLAVKHVYGDHAYRLAMSSTKSQLGHSLGASGAVELVVTIKAIEHALVPMTMNLDTPDPDCDLDYTPNQSKERQLSIAMSNSFGFGGHNASLVIGKLSNGA